MPRAQCPHCGAEYDDAGVATICSKCQSPLPQAQESGTMPPVPAGPPPAPTPGPAAPYGPPAAPEPSIPPVSAIQAQPAATTPSGQRRPCIKCGEPLYTTEMTCWKCGTPQGQAAAPTAPPPTAAPAPPVGVAGIPPPPYAPQPPASPYAQSSSYLSPSPEAANRGNWALILGIVGVLCCNLLGPVAIYLGVSARKDGAGGNATAGMVLGIIGTVLMVLGIIYGIVVGVMGAAHTLPGATP